MNTNHFSRTRKKRKCSSQHLLIRRGSSPLVPKNCDRARRPWCADARNSCPDGCSTLAKSLFFGQSEKPGAPLGASLSLRLGWDNHKFPCPILAPSFWRKGGTARTPGAPDPSHLGDYCTACRLLISFSSASTRSWLSSARNLSSSDSSAMTSVAAALSAELA